MGAIQSKLSEHQYVQLVSRLGLTRLNPIYQASWNGYSAAEFHRHCDRKGPTVIVAYNASGFIFGAYTSKDYTQSGMAIHDKKAFLYSISPWGNRPLKVEGIGGQCAFTDGKTGPNYGALVFLHQDKPKVLSNPGRNFNFQAAAMHGNDLTLTEFEVYQVEGPEDLPRPWRPIQWTAERKQQLRDAILSYRPVINTVHKARVLLVGRIGAGKSSFFNSINSAFRGNMTSQAIAGTTGGTSMTTQFRTYTIKVGRGGETLPLVLCDTMGLEGSADGGLDIGDLVTIYKGHIQDRYQFSPSSPLMEDSPGYKKQVTLNDTIHCVVYVVDTCTVSMLGQKMLDKFSAIRKKTNQLGIPQILLMTKVDLACSLVADDLKKVYHSVYIQKKAQQLSESLGIPLSCVLPVKNYSEELDLDQDTDILLFTAVQQMLNYADNFFENQVTEGQNDQM